ncbi:MAG: aminoacyl-tRNA hydrolase [Bacillota bacterium]|nr:aminoacyl-tRNA hydrolase [Bacillota bacterium]
MVDILEVGGFMYLIVGLGNPGSKYAGSRHNLGFRVIEALSRRLKTGNPEQKHWSLIAKAFYNNKEVVLAQPLTYMNLSGKAVFELLRNLQVDLEHMLVIYDDLDLPPGMIRIRKQGGSGGHKGIQSVIDSLDTNQFLRLRIGIGQPPDYLEVTDYVLLQIEKPDQEIFDRAVDQSAEAVLTFINDGIDTAMNNFNQGLSSED